MKIIIVGAGKVGYYLAKTLIEHGHSPRLIEKDKHLSQTIANDLDTPVFYGDGTIISVLESADVQGADTFISVTGKDEANLVACQLAKKLFGVRRTIARINNPKNAEVMKQLGVDIPVPGTGNIAMLIEREVDTNAIKKIVSLNRGEASISEVELPEDYSRSGAMLSELHLPQACVIVSITRDDKLIIPRGNTQLFAGDKVIIMAQNDVLHKLGKIFEVDSI